MNPQSQESQPSLSLPTPQSEQGEVFAQPENTAPIGPETQGAIAIEQGQSQQAPPAQATSAPSSVAPPFDPTIQPVPATAAQTTSNMPQIADDTDLIEKEWIVKAKQIVEQTAKDPYNQNREMSKVKADYLKKRYNKDLKLADE